MLAVFPDGKPELPPNDFVFVCRQHRRIVSPKCTECCNADLLYGVKQRCVSRVARLCICLEIRLNQAFEGRQLSVRHINGCQLSPCLWQIPYVQELDFLGTSGEAFKRKGETGFALELNL